VADAIDLLYQDLVNTEALQAKIRDKATSLGVDPALALSVAHQESQFNPAAISREGTVGLFQVTRDTGRDYGQMTEADRFNADVSMHAGISHLAKLLKETGGDVPKALMRYNGGGDPQYVQHVMQHYPLHAAASQGAGGAQGAGASQGAGADQGDEIDALIRELGLTKPAAAPAAAPPAGGQAPTQAPEPYSPMMRNPEEAASPTPSAPPTPGMPSPGITPQPLTPIGQVDVGTTLGAQAPRGAPVQNVQLTPGMTGEQVAQAYGYDPRQFSPAQLKQVEEFAAKDTPLPFGVSTGSWAGRAMHSFFGNFIGAGQLVQHGLVSAGILDPATAAHQDLLMKIDATRYARQATPEAHALPVIGDPAELVGNVAAGAVVPGIGRVPGVVAGAVLGAAQPVTTTSTTPGAPGDTFAQQKAAQVVTGGAAGLVGEAVARPLMWGVNKAINGIRGVFTNPADQTLLDLAAAHGVNPTYGDVKGAMAAPGAARAETTLERVPGAGAGAVRREQQAQTKQAAEAFQQHYVGAAGQAQYEALPQVLTMARQGDAAAQRAANLAQAAGDDPGRIMQASAELNLQALRGRAQQLYGRVQSLAAPLGDVPPTQTLAQAYAALDAIEGSTLNVDPTGATKAQIVRILDRFEPKQVAPTATPGTPYTNTSFFQPTMQTPPSPYAVMDKLSNELGTVINQSKMQDTYGAKILSAVKDAVDADMRQFALQSGKPELVVAQQAADRFYPQVVRQRDLVRGMEGMPSDELTQYMFQPRRGQRATEWFNALDAKGQAAARGEILTQALYDGPNPAIQPTTGTFSPARFAGNLERLRAVTGVTFPKGGPERWQLDGFVNLMRHMERAGQYAENPPTGQRLMNWLQIPQAVGGAAVGVAAGGTIGGVLGPFGPLAIEAASGRLAKKLFMDPAGRTFLLASARAQPGSPGYQRLLDSALQRFPEWLGQGQAQTTLPGMGEGSPQAQEDTPYTWTPRTPPASPVPVQRNPQGLQGGATR
jgi:Transglycosylase SLT domain